MNVVLLDTPQAQKALRPFSYTRPLAQLRLGICTLQEKWEHHIGTDCSWLTSEYLREKFPCEITSDNLCINSTLCPDEALIRAISTLEPNQQLVQEELFIAARCDANVLRHFLSHTEAAPSSIRKEFSGTINHIKTNWDLFLLNAQELQRDFDWITKGRTSQPINDLHTVVYNEKDIFLEEGVTLHASILNATEGPIYLGKNAHIHEGAVIRGPVAIGEGVHVHANAVVSNATTIGPYSKVGGEINNSILIGYSNKAHEGFMGNSVIGTWCNLGAGSHTSNLRSDYGQVKIWNEDRQILESTGLQFCGLFMGDHSKCGINTMFNAGTTVGINVHLFGAGFAEKFIPSFTWAQTGAPKQIYQLEKALKTAEAMAGRRGVILSAQDKDILMYLFHTISPKLT